MTEIFSKNTKSNDGSDEDMWDDTELIKAYDRALSARKHSDSSKKNDKCVNNTWEVNMPCRTIYNEDGIEYEGTIAEVLENGNCIVRFVGYENDQETCVDDIKDSHGPLARRNQEEDASPSMETENVSKRSVRNKYPQFNTLHKDMLDFGEQTFPPPPPLPPNVSKHMTRNENEAMSAMLMAWYMSGYYTGFYQGLKQSKNSKN